MKVFVEIETHDYMDMYPSINVHCFEENSVNEAITSLKEHWSGGTVNSYHIMTKEEAKAYVDKMIEKEKANWMWDSQEVIDNMNKLLNESYK